jgi:hypothetical protein
MAKVRTLVHRWTCAHIHIHSYTHTYVHVYLLLEKHRGSSHALHEVGYSFPQLDVSFLFTVCVCVCVCVCLCMLSHSLWSAAVSSAAIDLERLTRFRHFYILVVIYVYFTRIVVFLLESAVPFNQVWISTVLSECTALAFYCVAGYAVLHPPHFSTLARCNFYVNQKKKEVDDATLGFVSFCLSHVVPVFICGCGDC